MPSFPQKKAKTCDGDATTSALQSEKLAILLSKIWENVATSALQGHREGPSQVSRSMQDGVAGPCVSKVTDTLRYFL